MRVQPAKKKMTPRGRSAAVQTGARRPRPSLKYSDVLVAVQFTTYYHPHHANPVFKRRREESRSFVPAAKQRQLVCQIQSSTLSPRISGWLLYRRDDALSRLVTPFTRARSGRCVMHRGNSEPVNMSSRRAKSARYQRYGEREHEETERT